MDLSGLTFSSSVPDVWTAGAASVTGDAGPRTDLFVDPATGEASLNAPLLLTPAPPGDFQFVAAVTAFHGATYDAGALVLWSGDATWAKLAFEYAPQDVGQIVSVVTRGRSDDANGYTADELTVRLRISRVRGAYAFHCSIDEGLTWDLVRHFALDGEADVAIGLEVQSPTGDGFRARFSHIALRSATLTDLRDGS